jgi:hypothetical protein
MAIKKVKNQRDIDYAELVDFIANEFDKNSGQISTLNKKIEDIKKELKADINGVLTRVTVIGNNISDARAEQAELKRQTDAHTDWISKASPKIGIELK